MSEARPREPLDARAVTSWLRANDIDVLGDPNVTQYSGGASNWTYRLQYSNRDLVLRRPPAGTKAKGAHDMAREFRIQSALKPVYSVVPNMLVLCQDADVLGTEFYVMERIDGLIPRATLPKEMQLDTKGVRALCVNVIDKLIELHKVDAGAAGLTSMGKGPGYPQRQVDGWSARMERVKTWNTSAFAYVRAWLREHVPEDVATCVIHNDWRFDNIVLDAVEQTRVVGVLDWELATLGCPLMDLGSALAYWVHADDDFFVRATRRQPTHLSGMMRREEVVEYYLDQTGWKVPDWKFYEVFGLFRVAVIAQQIYFRYHHKQSSNPAFRNFWVIVNYLDWRCRKIIRST